MKLFGGIIGWRANKQDTVTTSTTEAELLSLAQATKEAMFVQRLLSELGIKFEDPRIRLWCDNKQTIGLINNELLTLRTKLRHVDIHNHWLREAAKDRIRVDHVGTKDMLADGLTKALSRQQFGGFREQLGLVNIEQKLVERTVRKVTHEDLETLQDEFEGGEAEWQG